MMCSQDMDIKGETKSLNQHNEILHLSIHTSKAIQAPLISQIIMKGFTMIVLAAVVALSSASFSVTKTDDVQGLGEFQLMKVLSGPNCYACSAPCAVAGKGCCSGSRFPQCRQIDGVACRCTQF